VVELEMQLDEVREQYKVIARSANSRAQQRKLEFLEHNLEALNSVQKQVRPLQAGLVTSGQADFSVIPLIQMEAVLTIPSLSWSNRTRRSRRRCRARRRGCSPGRTEYRTLRRR
jgi:hypothetical protein